MTFPDNCKANLGFLANSPTFAMSLGAKELFHTNFLAFLLESQDESVEAIQKKLKTLFFGHDKVGRVITWREKESLDLVIMPAPMCKDGIAQPDLECSVNNAQPDLSENNDGKVIAVVIEAKLKSIPTLVQLAGYDEKLKKGIEFELDEVDTFNVSVGKDTRIWQVMKLKLAADGGADKCNPECTIEARGKNTNGKNGKIKEFKGTVRRLLLRPLPLSKSATNNCAPPPLTKMECCGQMGCWEQMCWQCVVEALKCRHEVPCEATSETTQPQNCKGAALLPCIICDYRDSLEQLLSMLNQTYDYVNTSIAPPSLTYGDYYRAITDSGFKKRRIHDLIGKYASHILERHIMDFVCGALANPSGAGQNCVACSSSNSPLSQTPSFNICGIDFKLNSYTHFSNQQPGVGFEWLATPKDDKKERRVSFGVQIQGNAYRHFICAEGGNEAQRMNILNDLEKVLGTPPTNWFLNNQVFKQNPPNFSIKNSGFYVFDKNKFRYSKADISRLPLPGLAQVVCRSLCLARGIVGKTQSHDLCGNIRIFFDKEN